MEKELVELFEAAKKAADAAAVDGASSGGAEETRCLDALKQLKNFPVTYQVLVSTQVGKRLRHLTKHPRKKIQAFASELIEIWKEIIIQETTRNKKNGSSEDAETGKAQNATAIKVERESKAEVVKVERINRSISEKAMKAETSVVQNRVQDVKLESANLASNIKVDQIIKEEKQGSSARKPSNSYVSPPKLTSMVKCNDALRDKVREILHEALNKVSSEADGDLQAQVDACDPIRVAVSVESVMFENWGRTNGAQKNKYRSIMFNIKDSKNPDFRRKVLLGKIKPEQIPTLTAEEMASEQRKVENVKIKEKALLECERGGPPTSTTDQFKCGRCNQRKTTYYQLQTRSADEPMTTFVTCVNCNNRWKFC